MTKREIGILFDDHRRNLCRVLELLEKNCNSLGVRVIGSGEFPDGAELELDIHGRGLNLLGFIPGKDSDYYKPLVSMLQETSVAVQRALIDVLSKEKVKWENSTRRILQERLAAVAPQ
jgi:hypothetical protein